MRTLMKWVREYRREFVYSSFLFLAIEMLITRGADLPTGYFWIMASAGYLLILSWLLGTYFTHSGREVSKYSDVLKRISIKSRFFGHIALPFLYYTAIVLFIEVNNISYLNQFVIVSSVAMFFFLFLHVRTSYDKIYSVSRVTRIIFDFIGVSAFFVVAYALSQFYTVNHFVYTIVIYLLTFALLSFSLHTHGKEILNHLLYIILFSCVVALMTPFLWTLHKFFGGTFTTHLNSFVLPSITTVAYYTIISIMNVRFAGYREWSEYIPPIMYSLMAIILIFSL
jgi:hypothetical protein